MNLMFDEIRQIVREDLRRYGIAKIKVSETCSRYAQQACYEGLNDYHDNGHHDGLVRPTRTSDNGLDITVYAEYVDD